MADTIIIGVSGYKQSGKTSLCQYLRATEWCRINNECADTLLFKLKQDDNGDIVTIELCPNGSKEERRSVPWDDKQDYANMFGHVKMYSFADPLKEFLINVLGLTWEQCYGTNEQKNSLTKYEWERMPLHIRELYKKNTGFMSGREVMQVFGTNICREMFYDRVWVDATIAKIKREKPPVALIADVRFPSEVAAISAYEHGYLIRLTRQIDASDRHSSEISLDDYPWEKLGNKCLLINNTGKSIREKNDVALKFFDKIRGREYYVSKSVVD